LDAACCFNGSRVAVGRNNAMVVEVLSYAAYAVSCHAALTAVTIEHAHPGIGDIRFLYKHNTVTAYAVMLFAHVYTYGFRTLDAAVKVFYVYIVIACGVHLCEFKFELFRAHIVDINKLSVLLSITAGDNIGQSV